MVNWNDLNQNEQEAMSGKFPVTREFMYEYWKTLQSKNLVKVWRLDHRRFTVILTPLGKELQESFDDVVNWWAD